jgi:peptide-methionine (S)-S-oxide reductase
MAGGYKFVRDLGIFLVLLCVAAVVYSRAATAPVALPNPAVDDTPAASGQQTAVIAGGCFWGIQAVFEHVKGVVSVSAGYSGGAAGTANYETVSEGTSGHAESVEITYDPARISYGQLLKVFFSVAHDPTELNRQGPDTGTQYRSAIFYGNENQQRIARAYIDQLNGAKVFPQRIVTQVTPLKGFYRAEAYHQDYLIHHPDNPYIMINDVPKIAHLHQQLPDLYVEKPKA